MSGFSFAWRKSSMLPTPLCIEVLVGKSTQIHVNDVLVLSVNSTYTGTGANQIPVARPLLSGDTLSISNGLIGVALFDMQTDVNGNVQAVASPVTVDVKGQITKQLLTIAHALPNDPVSGFTRVHIAAFDPQNVFAGLTDTNEIANFYAINRSAGIVASAASFPANYTVDLDAATAAAALVVEGVDSEHPQFNSANGGGRVFVSCKSPFYDRNIGTGAFT